jgi:hypothetical protein
MLCNPLLLLLLLLLPHASGVKLDRHGQICYRL